MHAPRLATTLLCCALLGACAKDKNDSPAKSTSASQQNPEAVDPSGACTDAYLSAWNSVARAQNDLNRLNRENAPDSQYVPAARKMQTACESLLSKYPGVSCSANLNGQSVNTTTEELRNDCEQNERYVKAAEQDSGLVPEQEQVDGDTPVANVPEDKIQAHVGDVELLKKLLSNRRQLIVGGRLGDFDHIDAFAEELKNGAALCYFPTDAIPDAKNPQRGQRILLASRKEETAQSSRGRILILSLRQLGAELSCMKATDAAFLVSELRAATSGVLDFQFRR